MSFTKPRLVISSGTRAAQPSAADRGEGALYYVTDETLIERSDGSTWSQYGPTAYSLPSDPTFSTVNVSGTGTSLTVSGYAQIGSSLKIGKVSYNDFWCTDASQGLRFLAFDIIGGTGFNDGASLQFFGSGTAFPGNAYFGAGGNSGASIIFRSNGATATERLRITDNGVFVAGATGTTPGAPSTGKGGIVFYDVGTAFSGMSTDTAAIYADDVAGTTEMFVIDEAGNKTQISPHSFELFNPPPPDATKPATLFPWSYHSRQDYLGV